MIPEIKIVSSRPRKIVRWHEGYVVFVTKECKALGWNSKTIVKVYIEEDYKKQKIVIEKIGQL